jgi:diketogulonate reductase-like aldo/keto reductase
VVAIPKSSQIARIDENLAACDVVLGDEVLRQIDALFPPPSRKVSLAMV